MMEDYWDEMHPDIGSRWACLAALGSEGLTYPVRQVPLTTWGHTHFHFTGLKLGNDNQWLDPDPALAPSDEDEPWSGNFPDAFEGTDREYYSRLCEELERCTAALESMEEVGRERFEEAGESPPSYRDLKKALRDMLSASTQLLERKPGEAPVEAAPSPEVPAEEAVETGGPPPADEAGADEAAPETVASGNAEHHPPTATPAPPSTPASVAAEPRNADEAAATVAAAARLLRGEDPRNPIPYLLLRSLRWGEVRGTGERIDPMLLEAPRPEERKNLRSLLLEEQWEGLLEATEEVMASEAGRGWLDLQRYAILAADHLGSGYKAVTAALRGALRSHLRDLPSVATATLMDDSAAASSDTLQWLQAAGFLRAEGEAEGEDEPSDDADPEKARREASFARAAQMVQAGDPDGAIQLLMGRADRETSERASFITRGEAAKIMVERGEVSVARPILDELLQEIDEHNLEDWEAGDVVAKPLGLLFRCLDPTEGPLRQQIYERICRLDPLLARELSELNHGD
jgi:type VI secretion system protein ImpA